MYAVTERGQRKLLLDGYMYTKHQERRWHVVWRCCERNTCTARVFQLLVPPHKIVNRKPHSHPPNWKRFHQCLEESHWQQSPPQWKQQRCPIWRERLHIIICEIRVCVNVCPFNAFQVQNTECRKLFTIMLIQQYLFNGHLLYSYTKHSRMLLFILTFTVYKIVYHTANFALLQS